jgi:hypothetical protein
MRSVGTPCASRASIVVRIMISGPQTNAVVRSGRSSARATSLATKPTGPGQSCPAVSTVTSTSIARRHSSS